MPDDNLRKQLLHGLEMARDPRNALVRDPQAPRVTTLYSPWLLQVCRVCRHSFREEDLVRPDPARPERMLHEDPRAGLCCWSHASGFPPPPAAEVLATPTRDAFLQGLHTHWQPAGATRAELVPPRSELILRRCPICRHSVRPGDTVIRCPCGRGCGGVFHQDVLRHLTCWETWSRGATRFYCAFTGAPFASPEPDL